LSVLPAPGIIVARLVVPAFLAEHRDQIMLSATNPEKIVCGVRASPG
jgi:hypothetical protein